ncbi:MAG: glycosyltransferase family 4 protein [Candidatus Harrisonbacteria bacterium]|nr:glycosyltransferase family 4 protein [Candidatus Harrisonbacteria bacterium]
MEKLKMYYIANARMPTEKAHGIQLAKMCEAFAANDVELELVLPRKRNTPGDSLEGFYGLRMPLKIKKLPVIHFGTPYLVDFIFSAFTFAVSSFCYLMSEKLKGRKGIVYTIDLDYFSFFPIPFLGMPYFMEIHGEKRNSFPHRLMFRSIRGIITINRYIKNQLMETFGIPPDKIIVHPNGIDLDFFSNNLSRDEARTKLGLERDRRIALYTGQFYDWKGLEILISLAKHLGDIYLYVVGGTENEFKAITGTEEIPKNLIIGGRADFKDMPLWLAAGDALLVLGTKKNNISYLYTSPMKLFEYLAVRRPIIASKTPSNEEIVSEKEVLFYEPDNEIDFAEKVKFAVQNREVMKMRIEAAYKKAQDFSWEMRAKHILDFIRLVLNK